VERAGEHVTVTTLEELDIESIDMETIVIVGATSTASNQGRLYTPRGYEVPRDNH
jgi:precorrin-3B methylase